MAQSAMFGSFFAKSLNTGKKEYAQKDAKITKIQLAWVGSASCAFGRGGFPPPKTFIKASRLSDLHGHGVRSDFGKGYQGLSLAS
jgi:hypothetical protein